MGFWDFLHGNSDKKQQKKAAKLLEQNGQSNDMYEAAPEQEDPNATENELYMTPEEEAQAGPATEPFQGPVSAQHNAFFSMNSHKDELDQVGALLTASKKGGLGDNSDKFNDVKYALMDIQTGKILWDLGAETASEDVQTITQMLHRYLKLTQACDAYLNRKARTKAGKARQAIVATLKEIAERDAKGLGKSIDEVAVADRSERSKMTWQQLLKIARTVTYSDVELKDSSTGQISDVFKFKAKDEKTGKDSLKFFKPAESLDMNEHSGMWALAKYKNLYPEEQISERTVQRCKGATFHDGLGASYPVGTSFDAFTTEDMDHPDVYGELGLKAEKTGMLWEDSHLRGHGEQDITGRNVATSRVADLLGMSHLIARSQLAEVTDKDGNKHKGIVMEGAKDIQGGKFTSNFHKRIQADQADALNRQAAIELHHEFKPAEGYQGKFYYDADMLESYQGENDVFTGQFVRDITDLQVLDCICGQMDRHDDNMFFQTNDKGQLTGVTGIDNDAAFSNTIMPMSHESFERRDREVFSEEGKLTLPHVDEETAARVQALNPEILRFALSDLLNADMIDMTIKRLTMVQNALSTAEDGQIISGSQWNDPGVRKDMIGNGARDGADKISAAKDAKRQEILEGIRRKYGTLNPDELAEPLKSQMQAEKGKVQSQVLNYEKVLNSKKTYFGTLIEGMR